MNAASTKSKSKQTRQAYSNYGRILGYLGNIKKAILADHGSKKAEISSRGRTRAAQTGSTSQSRKVHKPSTSQADARKHTQKGD